MIYDFSIYDLRLCGAGVATTPSSSHAVQYSIEAILSRRRGRTPLATASRLTSFGGYLVVARCTAFYTFTRDGEGTVATSAPLLNQSQIVNHKS